MKQRSGMNELDRGGDVNDVLGSCAPESIEGQERHHGPNSFASAANQVGRDICKGLFAGADSPNKVFLDESQFIRHKTRRVAGSRKGRNFASDFRGYNNGGLHDFTFGFPNQKTPCSGFKKDSTENVIVL
jgi:hypothetical protein